MKKKIIFLQLFFITTALSAGCPPGYTAFGSNDFIIIASGSCPVGYASITTPNILPHSATFTDAKVTYTIDGANCTAN